MVALAEYRTDTVTLDHAEAAELATFTRGGSSGGQPRVIERLTPAAAPGTYEVQPGPYVGRLRLGSGGVLDIASRFPFQDLAVLLGLGRRATLLHDTVATAGAGHGLMDLIATAFVREAERLAGQGLAKAYRRETFLRAPYPGTPSATMHLRAHAGRPDRLATVANRLTMDIPANRLLAAAHRRLTLLPYADEQLTARLRALAPVFQRLGAPPAEVTGAPERYREAARLARLVLDGRTVLPTGTGTSGVSVLFNMTKIWEQYAGRWLRGTMPGRTVAGQHRVVLTDEGPERRTGIADFVVHEGGVPVVVADAKYRWWRRAPDTSEIYQLCMYAQRLGVTRAMLVYPSPDRRCETTRVGAVGIECWGVPVGTC